MAKSIQFLMSSGHFKIRGYGGFSIYWGHDDNHDVAGAAVQAATVNGSGNRGSGRMAIDGISGPSQSITVPNSIWMYGLLFEIDMASLPLNAVVQSASLGLRIYEDLGGGPAYLAGLFPMPITIYRLLRPVDFAAANMANYAGGTPWGVYGAGDGVDFRDVAEAEVVYAQGAISTSSSTPTIATFNLLELAKFVAASDSRKMQFYLGRSIANRKAVKTIAVTGGDFGFRWFVALYDTTQTQPNLTVTYVDPITFHPALVDGSIDLSRTIDSTDNGLEYFESISVGGQSAARKYFAKNQLTGSVLNLKIFSATSRGSMIWEQTRTAVGNGLLSDITTTDKSDDSVNYTRTERWRCRFATGQAATNNFTVERDNGTFDDPTVPDAWTNVGTGTLGTLFNAASRGTSFTLSQGGVAFVDGDIVEFRTFEDDAHPAARADSEDYLETAPDNGANAPGNFQRIERKRVKVTAVVSSSTTVPVTDGTPFKTNTPIRFFARTTGVIQERVVGSVAGNTLSLTASITLALDDYAEAIPIGVASLAAGGTHPFWMRAVSPAGGSRATRFPRWRGEAD